MPVVAEHFQLAAVERRLEFAQHFGPEIIGERFHVVGVGREHDAAMGRDVQLVQSMVLHLEIGRHAAFAGHAAAERNADQVAFQIVGPLVIGADEFVRRAAQLAAEFRGAVRAAVLERMDRAVRGARHHDRGRPDIGADEIAGVRNLRLERDIVPGRAVEDALDFALVNRLVGIDPVGNDGEVVVRPDVIVREVRQLQRHCGRPDSIVMQAL